MLQLLPVGVLSDPESAQQPPSGLQPGRLCMAGHSNTKSSSGHSPRSLSTRFSLAATAGGPFLVGSVSSVGPDMVGNPLGGRAGHGLGSDPDHM